MASDDRGPNIETDSEFTKFFNGLKDAKDVVRIFDHNNSFSIHGDDAVQAADELYATRAVLRSNSGLQSLTMTRTVCERFIRQVLLVKGKKIEIWSGGKSSGWQIDKEASPGNLQGVESFLTSKDLESCTLLSVQVSQSSDEVIIGMCYADIENHMLGAVEVIDSASSTSFEALIIQLGVRECIMNQESETNSSLATNFTNMRAIMQRCNVVCSFLPAQEFRDKSAEENFAKLLLDPAASSALSGKKVAIQAASALLKYLALLKDPGNIGQFHYWKFDSKMYMNLDGSALKALSLFPSTTQASNRTMSLFGLLNRCRTTAGSKLLSRWLKQPLLDLNEITHRHALVEYFFKEHQVREALQGELKTIPDLVRLTNKFRKSQAGLEDVVRAYQVAIQLPGILAAFEADDMQEDDRAIVESAYTTELNKSTTLLKKFEDLVETTVDLAALDRHEYLIRADFDENLGRLSAQIDNARQMIDQEHHAVAENLNVEIDKKLKLENHSTFGFCLRLSRVEASNIRNVSGYRELQTSKAGVYFTNNMLSTVSKSYAELYTQYSRHQAGLVREVVSIAASYCPVFEGLGNVLAHLDVILAFAELSLQAPTAYVRPKMNAMGEGNTVLKESRHPCIEAQDDISFIPNDVALVRNEAEFLIITGANMGGKSTYIRQVGMIVLMAQIGCFVPCESAEITIVDSILARVGAGDSQLKGLSTFMSECLEISTILKVATKNSLIIIDELGRGTSTTDGYGLAFAISEHIINEIGTFALFATHFHELTALVDSQPTVKNLHVSTYLESGDTGPGVTLLYKIVEGSCNQSFGIHVAQIARFPKSVVDMAKRKLDELEKLCSEDDDSAIPERKRSRLQPSTLRKIFEDLRHQKEPITLPQLQSLIQSH